MPEHSLATRPLSAISITGYVVQSIKQRLQHFPIRVIRFGILIDSISARAAEAGGCRDWNSYASGKYEASKRPIERGHTGG